MGKNHEHRSTLHLLEAPNEQKTLSFLFIFYLVLSCLIAISYPVALLTLAFSCCVGVIPMLAIILPSKSPKLPSLRICSIISILPCLYLPFAFYSIRYHRDLAGKTIFFSDGHCTLARLTEHTHPLHLD